ncbi:hypothetical protein CC99x_005585 [Candidatus Berkiella cookevillensis]|uniref:Lipoprotein SmpA/OmlA domain-containing protein n=1 Tax=Candidatus Berkiella cookevillensis TaxID=437022 RepID=A0A0Q9YTW9_9GAMM|nr:hypothetical protein [Candidatus Berkiella cookevillensis]MCS5708374.1 hypothetical protein [Candidatus Berkiella cookevillensis]
MGKIPAIKLAVFSFFIMQFSMQSCYAGASDVQKNDNEKPVDRVETLPNQCDLFTQIPIGAPIEEAVKLLGQPLEQNDISLVIYTWRIDDNFLSLQYDRGQLTTVEIDQQCQDQKNKNKKACDYFFKFKANWPEYAAVEQQLGKPVDSEKIQRDEWVWRNKSEKVYLEIKDNEVQHIECIPAEIKYIYEDAPESEDASHPQDDFDME